MRTSRIRELLPLLTFIYLGIILLFLPYLEGNYRYSIIEFLVPLGPVFITLGFVWYLFERMGRKIDGMNQSINNLNSENINEVSVVSPATIPVLLQNLDPILPIILRVDFTQANKSILELVSQLSERKAAPNMRILLTGLIESTTIDQITEIEFEKKYLRDLLRDLHKRKPECEVRATELPASNSVLIAGSIIYLLVPLEPKGTTLLVLRTYRHTDLGSRQRDFFEKTWEAAKEY